MWHENIKNRTFGYELEFADADKSLIQLPEGYRWTDNKLTLMNNSDGSSVTHNGQFGGEINTRPYHYTEEDLKELDEFILSIKNAGGYLMWNEGFDAHFYVKDLELDVIKRMFALSYYTVFSVKRIFDFPEWWDTKYLAPTPPYSVVKNVLRAESIESLVQLFNNGSDRGHIRYWLNLVPITKIGTAEFRIFNSSWDFKKTLEAIKFMYSFTEYAYLNEDINEYKKLNSVDACIKAFNINPENTAKRHKPLPWAAEHDNNVTVVGEMFKKTSRMLSYIKHEANKYDCTKIVNSYYTDLEQVINSRKIEVYTKEYFIFLMYEIIQGKITSLNFSEDYDYLDIESTNKAELLAVLFLFNQIKKHQKSDDIYHKALHKDFLDKLDHYRVKYTERYQKMVDNLSSKKIDVFYGYGLEEAVASATDKDLVVYQSEFQSGLRAAGNALHQQLTTDYGFIPKEGTNYANIDLEQCNYILITQHQFMGRKKVLRDGRTCLYSNCGDSGDNSFNKRTIEPLKYRRLPDNYNITSKSRVRFIRASMSEIDYLRMIYLKKDIILGSAPFCYLWFIDDYVFGASMFDFLKVTKYGFNIAYMKSDFVIDSAIPRISKLLIMATLSEEYKKELNIRYRNDIRRIHTSVFTDKPVSMKYRGVYHLDERATGKLYYSQEAGKLGSLEEVMNTFVRKHLKK